MSPRDYFAQSQRKRMNPDGAESHAQQEVTQAIQFAFAPITRRYKSLAKSRRFFRRGRQSGESK